MRRFDCQGPVYVFTTENLVGYLSCLELAGKKPPR